MRCPMRRSTTHRMLFHFSHLRLTAWVLSAALTVPASSESQRTRDSAAVRIVMNDKPAWGRGKEWKVSDQPILQIGTASGDPDYELSRVKGIVRMSDGRYAIG